MKRNLQSHVALIGTGLLASAVPAFAQPAASVPTETDGTETGEANTSAAEFGGIQDIIVTARRREERLQKVPIAVTVFSGDDLNRSGIDSGIDLARSVPSLVVRPINISTNILRVGLRGVINNSTLLTDDPSVGLYFAEVPIAHPYGLGSNFYDLENVQVLKGPQGILFGRNTTGGAILVSPRVANVGDEPEGYLRLTYGTYDARAVEGAVNLPLGSKAAIRLAGVVRERDGYTTNILTGMKYDDENRRAFRASITLAPAESVTSTTLFDYLDQDEAPNSGLLYIVYPGANFGAPPGTYSRLLAEQKARGPRKFASWMGTNGPLDLLSPARCRSGAATVCRKHTLPQMDLLNYGVMNNTRIEIGDLTLKNIASFRRSKSLQDGIDLNPGGSLGVGAIGAQAYFDGRLKQVTEEIQLSGKALSSRLDFTTGLFYIREYGSQTERSYFASLTFRNGYGPFSNKAMGAYVHGSFAVTSKLNVTAGLRFNRDKRRASTTQTLTNNGTTCAIETADSSDKLPLNNCILSGSKSWTAVTWSASAQYSLNNLSLVYISARRGYKSGGFGWRTVRPSLFSYDPEYVNDIEVGLKSDWRLFGRPIRTNIAAYQSKYSDQQVSVNDFSRFPALSYVSNVGKSRIRGFEFETTIRPTSTLTLTGFVSYTDAKFLEYIDPGTGADFSYRPFGIPKWLGGVSADYRLPLANDKGVLGARIDAQFLSKNIIDVSKPVTIPGDPTSGFAQNYQPGYSVVNGRVEWELPSRSVTIAAFVTNIFDKLYTNGGGVNAGIQSSNFSAPRMFGAEVTYRFGKDTAK